MKPASRGNQGKLRKVPAIRYARQPAFLKGMRDRRSGRPIDGTYDDSTDRFLYADGRQFAAAYPGISTRELKNGREDQVPMHVIRCLCVFFGDMVVRPGSGERALKEAGLL